MTTTLLIGRAISAMSFPGMYRIYDFHSKKAPKLRNAGQFTFFAPDSDDEDEDKQTSEPDPSEYKHFFKVTVNGDDIYLENPVEANESGWTPLHSCCMSMATVSAGIALIDETVRVGGDLNAKTIFGPGTFNKGWTALHMASGYGIDALVEHLVEAGADVNAVNCFGYSCLHEACHRGFSDVVKHLLRSGKTDLSYIPPDDLASGSPFASAPCQSPLAEAARCGFYKIVQQLLDAGAPKNLANKLGWTALHEACFYHRIETVKALLLAGCDPTLRTSRGALPYHLAGLPEIKSMLQNMGGDEAVPAEDDVIDMIQILTDLTLATEAVGAVNSHAQVNNRSEYKLVMDDDANDDENNAEDGNEEEEGAEKLRVGHRLVAGSSGSHAMPVIIIAGPHTMAAAQGSGSGSHPFREKNQSESGGGSLSSSSHADAKQVVLATAAGSGSAKQVLGSLPAFSSSSATASAAADPKDAISATNKSKGKGKTTAYDDAVSADMPKHFICALTHKPMSEPVKSIYGNVFDKTAIISWFAQQGRICPLTGLPLAEIELTPMPELGNEIRAWILKRSLATQNDSAGDNSPVKKGSIQGTTTDDLYDF